MVYAVVDATAKVDKDHKKNGRYEIWEIFNCIAVWPPGEYIRCQINNMLRQHLYKFL